MKSLPMNEHALIITSAPAIATVTYAERAWLLHAASQDRLAWAAAILEESPPRPMKLGPAELAAVEAILSDLASDPLEASPALGVGRVVIFTYRRRFRLPDPAIPIAIPLLRDSRYRRAVIGILGAQHPLRDLSWSQFRDLVREAIEAILRAAPGQLTRDELAFALLATHHLLADPSGFGLVRRFMER